LSEIVENRAFGSVIPAARFDEIGESISHCLQLRDLLVDADKVCASQAFDVSAVPGTVFIEREECSTIIDGKA